mmetsp:Transcript_284/g.825  ORF Transcript_284/g.825 Transcript_284/m.825 type:complete len:177 (-) Transcript_284:67-597(-)
MSLARSISTLAFVVSAVVHLGLVQSAGGLLDSCNAFGFVGVSAEECHAITTSVQRTGGQAEKDMLALAFAAMRGECCQFIGMGAGSVYALLFLSKGTDEVAVIHFMHSVWACIVQVVNSQNAGLLPFLPAAADEYDPVSGAKLKPFLLLVGGQAVLYVAAFLLSRGNGAAAKGKRA